ncbi:AFR566Cp [Eremothecium gossypii ATCC 10895]|uniref:rRNA biogenesis protein RRP5 n=1 Tax=Eremothecium gossypii (strain ATCC 10895 / CBS 109.51 / FGSC 9923 / NRRL Y-1056) TaxID=284811 RepID=Q752K8_EREGS|nr:AFR566Cp [Eremothecium gossypii ATCC 10895]AAS53937.2 AFR566Cp [Eremothecium gossypii ATCC 10895]
MGTGSVNKRKLNNEQRPEEAAGRQMASKSVLASGGDVAFPRGGASALTPLELKQVANEAASDVLFGRDDGKPAEERPRKKKKTSKASKEDAVAGKEDRTDIVEHLSFKGLTSGTVLLGQLCGVNRTDLCIALTDGLRGYVPLTNISAPFTSLLEQLDQSMDSGSEDEDDDSDDEQRDKPHTITELPELSKYFTLGQWLRCVVVKNSALDSQKKKNSRIELSIEPSKVNLFETEDLAKHTTVQCAVKSIEDHGALLDLGVQDVTGFISNKDLSKMGDVMPGSVFLANITKRGDRTATVNFEFTAKNSKVSQISSVDAVIPGHTIDFLCEKITNHGIIGKAFGVLDGFLSESQARVFSVTDMKHKYAIGSNIKVRIIATLRTKQGNKVILVSALPHILSLERNLLETEAMHAFPVGYVFDNCKLLGRDSQYLYVSLSDERIGQIHISKAGDAITQEAVKARVTGYNTVDGYYQLTSDPKLLAKPYLRSADIPVGTILSGCEITAVSGNGIELSLFDGQFKAFVAPLHISDIRLVYPERKFKIGSKVKGRVLHVDNKGRVYVTLKKSLVSANDSDIPLVSDFEQIAKLAEEDGKTLATVESFKPSGCVVTFLGNLKAFLPNKEISEAFVQRAQDHLRLGQTVVVKVLEHVAKQSKVIVTRKVSSEDSEKQKAAINDLVVGRSIVDVTVVEKTKDSVVVELNDVGLRGVIYVGHLSDSKLEQNRALLKKLRIGSSLQGVVMDKDVKTRVFNMSCKKSLIKDASKDILPLTFVDIKDKDPNTPMHGYVKSISDRGIFVAFTGKFVGLVLPSYATESRDVDIFKKFYINQSVTVYLLRTDEENERFLLTMSPPQTSNKKEDSNHDVAAVNPVDASVKIISQYSVGTVTKARVKSVKKTQLNVVLADNLHGRVDASEIYDTFEEIENPKEPLAKFKSGDVIDVKVIGFHDSKTHKFLPISHRTGVNTVLELSAKKSALKGAYQPIEFSGMKNGDELIGFVNNFAKGFIWLTLSPALKAKIPDFELSDDGSVFTGNLDESFPLGCALKVKVKELDPAHKIVSVSARKHAITDIKDIKVADKLPARIVKVADSYLLLDLGNRLTGVAFVTDALNEFSLSLRSVYEDKIGSMILASVVGVDVENKKINLSLRTEDATDRYILSHKDLKQGDVVRGFIKSVTDKGIFVYLSRTLQAFVPVSKLTDAYIKEWKKFYKTMQPITGKVVNCESDSRILLTMKESEVNGELKILKSYADLKSGDIFDGSVKNVTDFGVFVKLHNTLNVTGLAHKSEISDSKIDDLSLLFGEGDKVKAIILKTNPEKNQVSLGLKASYFQKAHDDEDEAEPAESIEEANGEEINGEASDEDEAMEDIEYEHTPADAPSHETSSKAHKEAVPTGLSLSAGFDWTASILDQNREDNEESSEDEDFTSKKAKKNKKRHAAVIDRTVDINTKAPESVGDFERLIMGNPNSSVIWMNYMAFQLQLSEVEKARELAERALKTISFREEHEKLNIWIAMLNLENTFGTDETLEDVFRRACQYMDAYTIHMKLISIYAMSSKDDKAVELYKAAAKKFGSENVSLWVSWGEFLLTHEQPDEARAVLAQALKSLPRRSHIDVVRKFAQLEFAKGDPEQGRALFEGLLADAPKRIDIWNVYLDQEIKSSNRARADALFERVLVAKLSRKQAKFFFNKWLQLAESTDDQRGVEYIKARAADYVRKHDSVPDAE